MALSLANNFFWHAYSTMGYGITLDCSLAGDDHLQPLAPLHHPHPGTHAGCRQSGARCVRAGPE
jgi:hypothetical protein